MPGHVLRRGGETKIGCDGVGLTSPGICEGEEGGGTPLLTIKVRE